MAEATRALCRLSDIEDGEGKGFVLGEGSERWELVVIREGERAFGYVNACPHVGTPLEMQPDRFMNADGSYILCHTHGALFEIESGYCIAGPCAGQSLRPVGLRLAEGLVFLA